MPNPTRPATRPTDVDWRSILTPTDVRSLRVGTRVLCFQPPDNFHNPISERAIRDLMGHLFKKSRILSNSLERGSGWWVGIIAGHETETEKTWALVRDPANNKIWDMDGHDFPIYDFATIPAGILQLLEVIPGLMTALGLAATAAPAGEEGNLESEFFSRGGVPPPGPPANP